jgi:hypothetical protein
LVAGGSIPPANHYTESYRLGASAPDGFWQLKIGDKMSYEKEAFYALVADIQPAAKSYISLYVTLPFFGGPEEGGWWGSDTELVAFAEVSNGVEANAIRDKVVELAEQMSKDAKDRFNRQCATEVEWVEQHDPMADVADYYPEVDGEETYWVATESTPGSMVSQGSRHYE